MANKNYFYYSDCNEYIINAQVGRTSNGKIANKNDIVVQFFIFATDMLKTLSKEQLNNWQSYPELAHSCGNCPLRTGGCYTHKGHMGSGIASKLSNTTFRAFTNGTINKLDNELRTTILKECSDRYVRFGAYGCPSKIDIEFMSDIVSVCKTHTGYTHEWKVKENNDYSKYLMASTHNSAEVKWANKVGFRAFTMVDSMEQSKEQGMVHCPASKERNFKTICSDCGLCSGASNKSKRNIGIIPH